MLWMVEKGIRCQISHFIDQYVKDNNKYMKDSDKNKESSYVKYWDVNHLKGWEVSQTLSVTNFMWVENTSESNKDFMKTTMKIVMKYIFLKLIFNDFRINVFNDFTIIFIWKDENWKS